jgi:large subunit ribosomal protein L6
MSRIGKQLVKIPTGVEVSLEGNLIKVKGPKGELSYEHLPHVSVEVIENTVKTSPTLETKEANAFWGLTRSLINNMVIGVSAGFEKKLEIIGVGYKAEVQGNKLILSLGFSHKIEYQIPEGVTVEHKREKHDILTISGINKELVGAVAAKIRSYKKPEPYKGKGIKYSDEVIARKEGKSASSK